MSTRASVIVIAEDNPSYRQLMKIVMETMGYTVVAAENGQVAVSETLQNTPGIAVFDICMPVMSGLDAARQIRATMGDSAPFLIAFSALGTRRLNLVRNAGVFDAVFYKTKDVSEIQSMIRAAHDGAERERPALR
ncbi:MAG: response regulator [Pseudomonadota bacterium]